MDKKTENQENSALSPKSEGQTAKGWPFGLRWGRGVYGSKDVPIKLLDRLIIGLIAATVLLTAIFAINGGYNVTFDPQGGSAVETQRLRYGNLVQPPEECTRPGYVFTGWYTSADALLAWDFENDKVQTDMTLYAGWEPAPITVKLDLAGGTLNGQTEAEPLTGIYGEPYGTLPTPEKEGATFLGWQYSGQTITADTLIEVNGEHVLTAQWQE